MSTSKIGDMIGTESSRPVVSSGSDRGTSSGLWVRGEAGRRARQTINTSNAVPDDEPRVSLRTKPEATPCCCGVSSSDMILGKARAMSAMGSGLAKRIRRTVDRRDPQGMPRSYRGVRRTPSAPCAAVLHGLLQCHSHSLIVEQGRADFTCRRGSGTHSVPSDPGWTASPICSGLICGRHRRVLHEVTFWWVSYFFVRSCYFSYQRPIWEDDCCLERASHCSWR